jgi:hypothetical protein
MPFSSPDGGEAQVKLHQIDPEVFRLLDGFRYVRTDGAATFVVTPKALGLTDLASVPFGFRWFVNSYGRHTLPALLHDCLVTEKCARQATQPIDGKVNPPGRSEADDIFLEALAGERVPTIRRYLMWAAVTFSTRVLNLDWWASFFMALWIDAAIIGTVSFFWGAWHVNLWVMVLAVLGPLPFAALWGRSWLAGLWFGYGVILLVPASIVVHLSFGLYWLLEKALQWAGTRAGKSMAEPPDIRKF